MRAKNLAVLAALLLSILLPGAAPAATFSVLGVGDSLTDGTVGADKLSWVDFLSPSFSAEVQAESGYFSNRVKDELLIPWLNAGNTADVAVILAGTVDTALPSAGGSVPASAAYDEARTVSNIAMMVSLLDGAGIPSIILAPMGVLFPCDNVESDSGGDPTCALMDTRLHALSGALATLAGSLGTPFADLTVPFDANPSYFLADGVHPSLAGDMAIAGLVEPLLWTVMPEPASALLLGSGLALLATRRRRVA